MFKRTIFFSLLIISAACFGQSQLQVLNEKKQTVETILATFSGKPESFDQLITVGKEGFALTAENDHEYKFIFLQAIGLGYYYKQEFQSASEQFEQSYSEAVKAKMIEKSTKPLGNLVSIYHYMGEQDKADEAAQKLKQVLEANDTLKNKSDIYYNLGLYNQQQKSYYSVALNHFLKSAALGKPIADTAKSIKQKTDYAIKLTMVAEIYLQLKQPDKALQYLEYSKPFLSLSAIADISAYGKFIRAYALMNDDTKALEYYNLLHGVAAKSPGKWSELVSSNLEMADLALKDKDYVLAKSYIDKADIQSKLDNKPILTSSVNLSYGDYYKSLKDYVQADKYYKIAENSGSKFSKEQYASLLKSMATVKMLSGTSDAAAYFEKYIAINDSLTQSKITLNLAEMEAIFQNESKQQQITAKNVQLALARKQRIWLIAGISLAAISALLLLIIYRNKKKTADLLDEKNKDLSKLNTALEEANQTKAKLFSIISHDLRSPISQVYQFLKLQQLNPHLLNEQQKNELSNKIQTATASLLETMEDLLLWSKTQMNEFNVSPQAVHLLPIIETCKQLLQLNSDAKGIVYEEKISPEEIVYTDPHFLQTIFRNLLQNAIKASPENGRVRLYTKKVDDRLLVYVENEGELFTQEKFTDTISNKSNAASINGLGLRLVDELSKKIQADINFRESSANSTKAQLNLPSA